MKTMKAMKAMKKPKGSHSGKSGSRSGKSGRSGWETWRAKKSSPVQTRRAEVQTRRVETVSGDPELSDVGSEVHFECAANEKSTQTVPWIRRLRRARDLQDSTLQQ